MLSSPARREGRQRGIEDPGRGAPRHTGRRPFLGTRSSKQSPEPLVPVAAKAGMSPSGRAHGYQGHYKFPALPDPERTTKDSLRFPTVSVEPLLPPQNPNLVLGENSALLTNVLQPSRAEPFPQLVHQDPALLRIPPSRGLSAPCWPESEDEPRVLHTHSPAKQHRAVAVPGGAGRVRSAGGEARNAEPRGLPGTGRRGAAGWAHHCSPRAGQRSGGRHQTK